jgi:hypothetical protein
MVVTYIIGLSLGFFSFIINSLLLILIKKNIFGSNIKNIEISKNNAIIFWINYFVYVYILIFILKYNMSIINLDAVNVVVDGVSANVSGDILTAEGNTSFFLGSARLAYLIIAKNNGLSAYTKIGIVLSGGGLTYYKIIDKTFN